MPSVLEPFMNPPMMAIGDSLFQGVRSLTVRNRTSQLSAPALVAAALGLGSAFRCPDFPKPVLIHMERWLRMLPGIGAVKKDLGDNAEFWNDHALKMWAAGEPVSPSGRPVFENISVAASTVADLYQASPAHMRQRYLDPLPKDFTKRLRNLDFAGLELGFIIQAFNTCFTLNPSGHPDLDAMAPVDQVAARRPKRLLVNIGSNNGLWEMAFECHPKTRLVWRDDLKELGRRLNALPAEVEHIYFNSLALPSTVPNLMPTDADQIDDLSKPPAGGYYQGYENRFGAGWSAMSGAELEALDAHVAEENAAAQEILRAQFDNPARLHFVDLAELMKAHDAKHEGDRLGVRLKNNKLLRNVMLEGMPIFGFKQGGLMGLDGMHPTVPGYALFAGKVVEAIEAHEPGAARQPIDIDWAWSQDDLLTDMPWSWSAGLWLWRDIRRAKARGEAEVVDKSGKAQVLDAASRMYKGGD